MPVIWYVLIVTMLSLGAAFINLMRLGEPALNQKNRDPGELAFGVFTGLAFGVPGLLLLVTA